MKFNLIFIFLVCECGICDHSFIVDYYFHKKVTSIVLFTCYDILEDIVIMKKLNKKDIAAISYKLDGKSKLHLVMKASYWKIGILVDTRCYNLVQVSSIFSQVKPLIAATEYRIFDELRSWLILGNNLTHVLRAVNDEAFGLSTDFVIAISTNLKRYTFHDVYNRFKGRGSVLNVTYYGEWSKNTKLNVSLTQSKFRRRSNLNGLIIKAMFYKSIFKAADMPLEQYYEDYEHATKDSQSKFSYHILSHLSDIHNFSLHIQECAPWIKGDTSSPIERALANREIDITGTPLIFITRRLLTMKFLHQDWPFRTCFFFRNPESKNIEAGEIFRPFADRVWHLMALCITVSIAVLLVTLRHNSIESDITNFSNSFLIVLGALCQQSTDIKIKEISVRIAFLFILTFSLLIFNYYSASVVYVRLDDSTARINDSLVQLGKLNLKMATEDSVYLALFLKAPNWDVRMFYQNYWKKIPESEQYLLPDVGMSMVQKGGFAYHTYVETAYDFIDKFFEHRQVCETIEVTLGGPFITTFAVHYNSTFVEIGRVGLMRIAETGLRMRQLNRWQYHKPLCRKDILSATSITIYEFAPHIILLLIGALFAVIVLAFEFYVNQHEHIFIPSRTRNRANRMY